MTKHNQKIRVAVLGSAFNPPTRGHMDLIQQLLPQVDQVWLVPAIHHAWGKWMADYPERCEMTRCLVEDIGDPRVIINCAEEAIYNQQDPVFTFDLLTHLQQQFGERFQFSFAVGPDNAEKWRDFYQAEEIQSRWGVLVGKERQAIRSTLARERLAKGELPASMLSPGVLAYLRTHPIYQTDQAGSEE